MFCFVFQFLGALFPSKLKQILRRGTELHKNVFVLLACGFTVSFEESLGDLQAFAKEYVTISCLCCVFVHLGTFRGLFEEVVAFTQTQFQAVLASGFARDAAISFFVYCRSSVASVLPLHADLGSHTSVVIFKKFSSKTWVWSHPVRQPFGVQNTTQCPKCRCLHTLKKRNTPKSSAACLTLECNYPLCDYVLTCRLPSGATWFGGRPPSDNKDAAGAWFETTTLFA
jgi:hypothetical protein